MMNEYRIEKLFKCECQSLIHIMEWCYFTHGNDSLVSPHRKKSNDVAYIAVFMNRWQKFKERFGIAIRYYRGQKYEPFGIFDSTIIRSLDVQDAINFLEDYLDEPNEEEKLFVDGEIYEISQAEGSYKLGFKFTRDSGNFTDKSGQKGKAWQGEKPEIIVIISFLWQKNRLKRLVKAVQYLLGTRYPRQASFEMSKNDAEQLLRMFRQMQNEMNEFRKRNKENQRRN